MFKDALIPATTALSTAQNDGFINGILHGANVIMINVTPQDTPQSLKGLTIAGPKGTNLHELVAALAGGPAAYKMEKAGKHKICDGENFSFCINCYCMYTEVCKRKS